MEYSFQYARRRNHIGNDFTVQYKLTCSDGKDLFVPNTDFWIGCRVMHRWGARGTVCNVGPYHLMVRADHPTIEIIVSWNKLAVKIIR